MPKKKNQKAKHRVVTCKKIEKILSKRGFLVKRLYIYDSAIIFFDTGRMLVYVPSATRILPKTSLLLCSIKPEESNNRDEKKYAQTARLMSVTPSLYDLVLLSDRFFFTNNRRRKWKLLKSVRDCIKISLDLDEFLKNNFYNKSKVDDEYMRLVLNIPVPQSLLGRRAEYETYIDHVLHEMSRVDASIDKEISEIEKLRRESTRHSRLVSIDIEMAHSISKHEKKIRKYHLDKQLAKNLLKEGIENMAQFCLVAEEASHVMLSSSTEVAEANATLHHLE
jgi:hypothetical protein